jgi:catechol 2,3-dioxygenase-like lactoylglutathione lyase family enzyme
MRAPDGGTGLAFQSEPWYEPPVWPEREGGQTKMLHLDLQVADLEAGVAHALDAGATLCEHQPQAGVRVLLDPAGHPFCLFTD